MEVYLDNAATTKPSSSVRMAMLEVMEQDYANPSSLHKKGWEAEKHIVKARKIIADGLKCEANEIVFTSGGTEANNLAIIGTAYAKIKEGKHIVTTRIEHPSIMEPMKHLQQNGFEVTYLNVDQNGRLKETELLNVIRKDTILLSIMAVNNEIGAIQDLTRISHLVKEKNDEIVIHTDAVQIYGKCRLRPKRLGVDLLSTSAHKIHGPKGVGFLYKQSKVKMSPIIFGGGQEKNLRSGTENVPGIVGMGKAVEEIGQDLDGIERLFRLKDRLIQGIKSIPGTKVNGMEGIPLSETAPHIVSVSFKGIKSEILLHALEERGIFVSSGSACSSNHPAVSETLKAIGVKQDRLDTTLRFSHSIYTKEEEMEYTLQVLKELVPVLSRYQRR